MKPSEWAIFKRSTWLWLWPILASGWKTILIVLALALGFSIPYYGIQKFSIYLNEANGDGKKVAANDTMLVKFTNLPDTMLVKLINQPNTVGNGKPGTGKPEVPVEPIDEKPSLNPTSEPSKPEKETATTNEPIDPAQIKKLEQEWQTNYAPTDVAQKRYTFIFILLSFLLLGLLGYLGIYKFRYLVKELNEKDKDPEDLKDMFIEFKNDIRALGSPRKVIRFSNKVRVQYHLLNNFGYLESKKENFILMECLLLLEDLQEMQEPDVRDRKETIDWLQNNLKPKTKGRTATALTPRDLQILEEVYDINKDLIVQPQPSPPVSPK